MALGRAADLEASEPLKPDPIWVDFEQEAA